MRWLLGPLASALAGCSLIYNPNNLPRVVDAFPDADPCGLLLSDITPKVINEGQGTGGSAPALLVIRGNNIVNANLAVELKARDGTAVQLSPVSGATASADHAYLAFRVTAPVDDKLGNIAMTDVPLDVTVRQDAPADGGCMASASQTLSGQLVLRVLPELKNALAAAPVLYSQIETDDDVRQAGLGTPAPLELSAVSSIKLGGVEVGAKAATSGPGGYSAGATPGPGGGGDGINATGLTVATVAGGGGGAGFATEGKAGAANGTTGGQKGPISGEDQILSLARNRASAGGTGGTGLTVLVAPVPGGAGGGGGGSLVLTAGGDITTGMISAAGGDGASSGGGGGGGGAGAGGTVVARSLSGKVKLGIVTVAAGKPGSPGGGEASAGRVRWDSPVGDPPTSADRAAYRGPSFVDPVRVVTSRDQTFTLIGSSGTELEIRVSDGHDVSNVVDHPSVSAGGKATITPKLYPGYNQLCAMLKSGSPSEAVANTCIDVAFLP